MVDDCLGLGVLGNHFKGTPEQQSCLDQIDIITGSFGKTLGSSNGGFVTAKSPIIQTSRPYLFSSAVSSSVAATVIKSLELLNDNHKRSQQLNNNIKILRNKLQDNNINILGDEKLPIISIQYENQQQRDEVFEYLYKFGILCLKNQKFKNILQIKISSEHSIYDIQNLIDLIKSFNN